MNLFPKALLFLGACAALYGIVSAQLMYRDMRVERLRSESHVIAQLNTARRSDWLPVDVDLGDSTEYCLALLIPDSSRSSSASPNGPDDRPSTFLPGRIDIDVADPSGRSVISTSAQGTIRAGSKGRGLAWIVLDTLRVLSRGGTWRAQSRVSESDSTTGGKRVTILLSPVQRVAFNSYLQDKAPGFILRGFILLVGLISMFAGGALRRRVNRAKNEPGEK